LKKEHIVFIPPPSPVICCGLTDGGGKEKEPRTKPECLKRLESSSLETLLIEANSMSTVSTVAGKP
jgi:hypothetical protein